MLVINVLLLLLLLTGYLISFKRADSGLGQVDQREHKLHFLYPFASWILSVGRIDELLDRKSNVSDTITALYLTNKPELQKKLFRCKQLSLVLMVLFLFNLLSVLGYCIELSNPYLIDHKYILRPDYGEGNRNTELKVTIENPPDADGEAPVLDSQEVTVDVKERVYTKEKVEELFVKAKEYLVQKVLGDNKSKQEIVTNLSFVSSIPGTSIKVKWAPQDYSLIKSDGTVCNEEITGTGVTTTVKALLRYYEYQSELMITFQVLPKQYSKEEQITKNLAEALKEYSDQTATEQFLELPSALGELKLHWKDKDTNNQINLFVFGLILSTLLWVYSEKELELRMKKRKLQLMMDYPEIINKFTLLINAGMTIRQAWYKITEDYSIKSTRKNLHKRFAYEEMLTTSRELGLGLPENTAYEQFGRRCGLIPYIKFSSLISQNLKKGTKGFTELLMKEAMDAFEERKEIAKRLGEEAGTKLLLPMLVMLMIVFAIIMIPAFSTFS